MQAVALQNEFELHARAILGLPVNTALKTPGAIAVIYGGLDAKGVVFVRAYVRWGAYALG